MFGFLGVVCFCRFSVFDFRAVHTLVRILVRSHSGSGSHLGSCLGSHFGSENFPPPLATHGT